MAEKPKYEPDDEAQSKRFEDTARSHGADDPGALERALGVIVRKKPARDSSTPTNDSSRDA